MPTSTSESITTRDQAGSDLARRLDDRIDAAVGHGSIVGTVVLVAERGEVVYRRAAGYADREAGRPMRDDAIFRMASLTKPIVSATALALVDRGMLGLDDAVTLHIPEFRPRTVDGVEATITVRQLMTHTAGLSYGFFQPLDGPYRRANVSDGMDQPGLSIEENLRRIASVPLSSPPGEAWAYSVATDVLGEIVARVTASTLARAVADIVTGPFGMTDTSFGVVDLDRLATPYGDAGERPQRMGEHHAVPFFDGEISYSPGRILDEASFNSGGAGMAGTADDYLTFLETIRRGGAPVLGPAGAQAMAANAIGDLPVNAAGPGWGFSLAASVLRDPAAAMSPQSTGTWQWGGAYGHSWFVDPVRELVVVGMTNTAVAGMLGAFPDGIRDAVYGA